MRTEILRMECNNERRKKLWREKYSKNRKKEVYK